MAQQSAEDKKLYNRLKNGLKKLKNENSDLLSEKNNRDKKIMELNKMLSDRSTSNVFILFFYFIYYRIMKNKY